MMNNNQKRKIILEQFPVLFHGTDARILNMSEAERNAFHSDCETISKAVWPIFEPYVLGQEIAKGNDYSDAAIDGELVKRDRIDRFREYFDEEGQFRRFVLAVSIFYRSHFLEDTLFEHDAIYLTSFRQGAERYANRAGYFGEIGFVAYHLADAARRSGCETDDDTSARMNRIIAFAEDEHHPVVVEVDAYNPDYLLDERGEPLTFSRGTVNGCMFRYRGQIDLRAFPVIHVTGISDIWQSTTH